MDIRRCHLCNVPIYPGEKRCLISIHIFPDQEEEIIWEDLASDEDDCPMDECSGECCACEDADNQEDDIFREAHLVLCKDCQDQFMKNPFIKENLFFFRKEIESKNFH